MKRKGINLKYGQTWKIGKGTVKKVAEINNGLQISDTVKIIGFVGCDGLVSVQCIITGEQIDIKSLSLTELIS